MYKELKGDWNCDRICCYMYKELNDNVVFGNQHGLHDLMLKQQLVNAPLNIGNIEACGASCLQQM